MTQSISAPAGAGFSPIENSYQNILFEINPDGVVRITLNQPDSLNALTADMGTELHDAVRKFATNTEARVLVLTGAGRGFCSGANLKGRTGGTQDSGAFLRQYYNPMIMDIAGLEKPSICAVNGVAAGAGFAITLACDMRVASEKARFVSAFARIGLVPDCGLSYFLPRLIGTGRAMEITTMGGEINATEAYQWGMVNRVAAPDEFEQVTLDLATKLAKGPTLAIGMTKKLVAASLGSDLATMLEAEATNQSRASATNDFREGVMAFIEKRPAQFKGN